MTLCRESRTLLALVALVAVSDGCARSGFEVIRKPPTPIYRSIGLTTAPLADGTGGNMMHLAGSTVTFARPLPDNIGVGDGIQFDGPDADTEENDGLVFIDGRRSSTQYIVETPRGAAPSFNLSTTAWHIYRAYSSAAFIQGSFGNSSFNSALRDFDRDPSIRDLVANDTVWNYACYDDGVDPSNAAIDHFVTSPRNYVRMFTPTLPSEVGVSQRHTGRWGTGYRVGGVSLSVAYAVLDGISIDDGVHFPGIWLTDLWNGEIRISNCMVRVTAPDNLSSALEAYWVHNEGLLIWNSVFMTDSSATGSGFGDYSHAIAINSDGAYGRIVNCTAMANNGSAFRLSSGYGESSSHFVLENDLGVSRSGAAFSVLAPSVWDQVDYCASNDASAALWGGSYNRIDQTFSFVDENKDPHLRSSDSGARDFGTDLSHDPVLPFDTDIDGQTRPFGPAWDIGADEAVY